MADNESPLSGRNAGPAPLPPALLVAPAGAGAAGSDAVAMAPARSVQHSEAQLMKRCEQAVEQCRTDLTQLRAACKAATSHREKCTELLGAATEAVVALEEMLFDPHIDLRRERALQQLAGRVQTAMDQGEVVVRVYGSRSGFLGMVSKVCSPGTGLKFDAAILELASLAKQVRLAQQQQHPAPPPPARILTVSTATADSAQTALGSAAGSQGGAAAPMASAGSGSVRAPASPSPIAQSQLAAAPSSTVTVTDQDSTLAAAGGPPSSAAVVWGDRQVPEEAMQEAKIHRARGASKEEVMAMAHVPPPAERPGHLGHLWYFLAKTFGSSSFLVYDLSAKVESEIREGKQGPDVTCMHYDDVTGHIWTGHKGGSLRVWSAAKQESVCPLFRGFNSTVTALTTDEHGCCWAASDKGKVRSFRLAAEQVDGVDLGYRIVLRGELNCAGDGVPAPPISSLTETPEGFYTHALMREPAHYGPVRSIAAAEGRVWTCGGSSAFASFKEWTQKGFLTGSWVDLRYTGLINDIALVTQLVVVNESHKVLGAPLSGSLPAGSALSSFTASASLPAAARLPVAQTQVVEIDMPWQLLTAHDGGMVQIWGYVGVRLHPLLRIGERIAPALRVMVCETLGALITAHNDGMLRVRALPHPRSPSSLTVTFKEKDLFQVSNADLAEALIQISRRGLVNALGGFLGVITAANSGSIKHLPVAELRRVAQEKGVGVLGPLAADDPNQWPIQRLSSAGVRLLMEDWAVAQQHYSTEYEEELHTERDGSEVQERPASLSTDTTDWLIEWGDLQRSRIIGEGAFGKVFLGRWQETDVAIKQLGSLSALGVQTGSLHHDSSGGIKLDCEVQRALDKEVDLLRKMRHPNIILFMGVVLDPPAVVTEYCARGSLYDLLREAAARPALTKALDWSRRIVMALDAAKGMLYLHGHKPDPIIHRDLKSPNLLVTKDWRVKVTDFNLSKSVAATPADPKSSVQSLVANNPRWQPPEVIREQAYSKASDVYSFGLILWELLAWELPFSDLSNFQIMMAVTQQGRRPPVKDQWAAAQYPGGTFSGYEEYVALMQRCWDDAPEARPTFEEIITDLRKVAKILTDSRALARPSGAVLLPSQSRNFARFTPPHLSPSPQSRPQSPMPAAAATPAPTATLPATNGSALPSAPAAAAAAAAGAAAYANGPFAAHAHQQRYTQQHQAQPSPPGSTADSTAAQPRSEAGTEPPLSAATSGSMQGVAAAPAAGGAAASSTAQPPPSPFGAAPVAPTVMASNATMLAGPFGGGPAPWLQPAGAAPAAAPVASSAVPPPSPFDAPPAVASGQTISSSTAVPPSPFGGSLLPAGGQAVSSAASPPPSPFGAGGAAPGQAISSAAVPPASPFGGGAPVLPAAAGPVSSAAQPPPSPFGAVQHAPAGAHSGMARLSPFAAHAPVDFSPDSRTHLDIANLPSTVLEASASVEAEAAGADGQAPGASGPAAGADGSRDSFVARLRKSFSGSGGRRLTRTQTR